MPVSRPERSRRQRLRQCRYSFAGYGIHAGQALQVAYSRAALPKPFVYRNSQPKPPPGRFNGLTLCMPRDLLANDTPAELKRPRMAQIMACLFELYGLEDIAAEIVLRCPAAFSRGRSSNSRTLSLRKR